MNKSNVNGKSRNEKTKEIMAVGVGIAALAAGAYFFLGPKGKKYQRKLKGWAVKMKGEILEKLEEAKEVSEPIYNKIVDAVAATEIAKNKIPKKEILELVAEIKKQWRVISKKTSRNSNKKTKSIIK